MKLTITDKVKTPNGVGVISEFRRFWSDKGNADHAKVYLDGSFDGKYYPITQLAKLV